MQQAYTLYIGVPRGSIFFVKLSTLGVTITFFNSDSFSVKIIMYLFHILNVRNIPVHIVANRV